MSTESAAFNYCCGFTEIGGFGEPDEVVVVDEDGYEQTPKNRRETISETKSTIKAEMTRNRGGYIATTVQSQWHAVAALRALGFRTVPGSFSGTGRNRITLWYKNLR